MSDVSQSRPKGRGLAFPGRGIAPPRRSIAQAAFVWLQRLVAAYCLVFGVTYWVRIVGVYDQPLWRFDLMPVSWQVVSVTLAALFPFAAIGLWMLASWGPVIWLICAATELTMYLGFPRIFGSNRWIVASHLLTIALYACCRILIALGRKEEAEVSGN